MADFQNNLVQLRKADATVVALSVDSREDARGTVDLTGALYPIVYGLDAEAVREKIGCYIGTNYDPHYMQATSFILRPDGTIALANYSSDQVPRLRAAETASFIEFLRNRESE